VNYKSVISEIIIKITQTTDKKLTLENLIEKLWTWMQRDWIGFTTLTKQHRVIGFMRLRRTLRSVCSVRSGIRNRERERKRRFFPKELSVCYSILTHFEFYVIRRRALSLRFAWWRHVWQRDPNCSHSGAACYAWISDYASEEKKRKYH